MCFICEFLIHSYYSNHEFYDFIYELEINIDFQIALSWSLHEGLPLMISLNALVYGSIDEVCKGSRNVDL